MNWAAENWDHAQSYLPVWASEITPGLPSRNFLRKSKSAMSLPMRAGEDRGRWVYLHCDGAIGESGLLTDVRVQLPGSLAQLRLPPPPTGAALLTAVQASIKMLALAPDQVTFPLYAAIWAAIMGSIDFSLFLAGQTGAGKTELAAQGQQHFGSGFSARNTPGSWVSTGNANEGLAFSAKDMLFTVDDFAPNGSQSDMARYHREADRLLRAQGNASGRQRMRPDANLRPLKRPRGLIWRPAKTSPEVNRSGLECSCWNWPPIISIGNC